MRSTKLGGGGGGTGGCGGGLCFRRLCYLLFIEFPYTCAALPHRVRSSALLIALHALLCVRSHFSPFLADLHSITFSLWAVAAEALPGGVCADPSVGAV